MSFNDHDFSRPIGAHERDTDDELRAARRELSHRAALAQQTIDAIQDTMLALARAREAAIRAAG